MKRCIDSILEKSTYENYDIVVVENNSTSEEIFAYYEEIKTHPRIQVVTYDAGGEVNYSRINNFGARFAKGEYLILLNNDTQVITINWIEEMLMYGLREDVGAVGAKLYYENKTIQHAGIVLGLGAHRTAGHSHHKVAMENVGYMGKLCYAQDVSAVTGACMMVKKSLYEELGGLSEDIAVALNDVDFCLKVRKLGYLVVYNPHAKAYHYESKSRGAEDSPEKTARFQREIEYMRNHWIGILKGGDPYYNPNFSLDRSDFTLRSKGDPD